MTLAKSRARRIKYETSKRFCRDVIKAAVAYAPILARRKSSAALIQSAFRTFIRRRTLETARREKIERQMCLAAARKVQDTVRVYLIKRRFQIEEERRREAASTIIAACARKWLSTLRLLQELQYSNAVIMQSFARVALARIVFKATKKKQAVIENSEVVLRRFFAAIFALQAARTQKLQDESAVVIQKHLIGYCCRKKFLKLRRFVTFGQKIVRGYLVRKYPVKLMKELTVKESSSDDEETCIEQLEDDQSGGEDKITDESEYGEKATEEICIVASNLNLDDSARLIQQWFRQICQVKRAAFVITNFLRDISDARKARLHLKALKENTAVLVIQCRVRAWLSIKRVESIIDIQLQQSLEEMGRKFNEEWRASIIARILLNEGSNQKELATNPPTMKKVWLTMIPEDAHPPFPITLLDEECNMQPCSL